MKNVGTVDVVVIGAGIAGLATAYELSLAGTSFVVLEASGRAGGVIYSEHVDGFTIDAGPDSLLVQKPEGIKLCEELGLGHRLMPTGLPRLSYILRGGRLVALPAASVLGIPTRLMPFVTTPLFSWPAKLRMGAEIAIPARRDDADESIGAFMRRRFGNEAVDYLAEPLLAGIHAGDVDRLSMKALFPRIFDAERKHGSVIRAFRRSSAQSPTSSPRRPASCPQFPAAGDEGAFRSLPGGLAELVEALVKRIGADRLQTGAAATVIEGSSPFQVRTSNDSVTARSVVFATPAHVTASLVRDRDAELSGICGEIPYASVATVALAFASEAVAHPLNGSGFVVPRIENRTILAASWLSSKWPGRAPDNRVLLRTFLGGARDPDAIARSDAHLVSMSMAALSPVLGIRTQPLFARVYRWARANAQHEVGHLERIAALDVALARRPGIFVTGSGFRGVGIPDCIGDGRATARAAVRFLKS